MTRLNGEGGVVGGFGLLDFGNTLRTIILHRVSLLSFLHALSNLIQLLGS